jgi:hypothetical protein
MVRDTVRYKSGESSTPITKNNNGHISYETSTTSHYSNENVFLCQPCWKAKKDSERTNLIILVTIIIGGIAVANFSGKENKPVDLLKDVQQVESVVSNEVPVTSNIIEPINPEADVETTTENVPETSAPVENESDNPAPAAENVPLELVDVDNVDVNIEDISNTVQEALNTGDAKLWTNNGKRGYVLVSSLQAGVSEKCRTLSISLILSDSQQRSAPHYWCLDTSQQLWVMKK